MRFNIVWNDAVRGEGGNALTGTTRSLVVAITSRVHYHHYVWNSNSVKFGDFTGGFYTARSGLLLCTRTSVCVIYELVDD